MIFTDLYKSPRSPLAKLRHTSHAGLAPGWTDYDADLVSKDKVKQKEAVKRHLQSKVRNDWSFTWPRQAPETIASENNSPSKAGDEAPPGPVEGYLEVASESAEANDNVQDDENTASNSDQEVESDSDAASVYSTMSEDPLHWRPRLEWTSELSDDELPYNSPTSFKFDTPDSVGHAVTASKIANKAKRRKELRQEMAWNDGLACFEARRNAWTGAKVAQVRPKPTSPVSPASHTRKAFFWRTHTQSSSTGSQTGASPHLATPTTPTHSHPEAGQPSSAGTDSDISAPTNSLSPKITRSESRETSGLSYVETMIPIPPPLLPPANPMRASINPTLYNSIYEKVVVHSLQPSCPINLSDMIRACVSGWKRDGEWPPRAMVPEPAAVVAIKRKKSNTSTAKQGASPSRRKMSFSFLNAYGRGHDGDKEKDKTRRESATGDDGTGVSGTGKAIRRSLQKVLGIGHSPTLTSVGDEHAMAKQH
ncbi:hypothetical protein BD289DRAFT_364364 [Coniella lustricola]|uniref:Gag1-like clamp domain-containing protein n=1 Tax=Coniella lustricola TaxID=2025994 RepID=A0A2T3ADV2_9PEZI|nr:hypothetical protein BD289DRAFT_364364 [Coniella lustricola]